MPSLPRKKVGLVACSGEELAEGTVTRLAVRAVLDRLRPEDTVAICLPLFLAGGEGDRAFARFYPTIAVDGCEKRCAARATEMYSARPAASIVVTEIAAESACGSIDGRRRLNEAGRRAVEATAERIALDVDALLSRNSTHGQAGTSRSETAEAPADATCACGSGIPVRTLTIEGEPVTIVGLAPILERLLEAGKPADDATRRELLELVKIYNAVPESREAAFADALIREYSALLENRARSR
jgi:uncharacterized metal-binding protein